MYDIGGLTSAAYDAMLFKAARDSTISISVNGGAPSAVAITWVDNRAVVGDAPTDAVVHVGANIPDTDDKNRCIADVSFSVGDLCDVLSAMCTVIVSGQLYTMPLVPTLAAGLPAAIATIKKWMGHSGGAKRKAVDT